MHLFYSISKVLSENKIILRNDTGCNYDNHVKSECLYEVVKTSDI